MQYTNYKIFYWFEDQADNSLKFISYAEQEGNYFFLTGKEKFQKSNIVHLNYLKDMGISAFTLLNFIPHNISNFNICDSLQLITDISISSYFLTKDGFDFQNDLFEEQIKTSLNKLNKLGIDTISSRIIFAYLRNINEIVNEAVCDKLPDIYLVLPITECFSNLFNYIINLEEIKIGEAIFIDYFLIIYQDFFTGKLFKNDEKTKRRQYNTSAAAGRVVKKLMIADTEKEYNEQKICLKYCLKRMRHLMNIQISNQKNQIYDEIKSKMKEYEDCVPFINKYYPFIKKNKVQKRD